MARLAAEGQAVHVLILGEGITSRYADRADAPKEDLEALRSHAQNAAGVLGVKSVAFGGLPDNRFDTVALLDIVKIVEEQIQMHKPQTIYSQHGGDLNIDHERTFRAVLTAARPMEGSCVRQVLSYYVGSSSEWSFAQFDPVFRPTVFTDIGATLEKKLKAMQQYEGESRSFPHPRSPEALRAQAQYFGTMAGLSAAEAFNVIYNIQ
ncbi:MAG: PIG-L family deacetylase, partial [Candidatus Peregrinibacteria bacterium]|nr:PIG-L family deacetylase [Candidatus Peregrinibacteria bacterium]